MIKEILEKIKNRKAKFKDAEDDLRIQKTLLERQKNSNERELESYIEEERQKKIKKSLDFYRKKKQHEFYHGNSLLKNNYNMMKNLPRQKNNILKVKKIGCI